MTEKPAAVENPRETFPDTLGRNQKSNLEKQAQASKTIDAEVDAHAEKLAADRAELVEEITEAVLARIRDESDA